MIGAYQNALQGFNHNEFGIEGLEEFNRNEIVNELQHGNKDEIISLSRAALTKLASQNSSTKNESLKNRIQFQQNMILNVLDIAERTQGVIGETADNAAEPKKVIKDFNAPVTDLIGKIYKKEEGNTSPFVRFYVNHQHGKVYFCCDFDNTNREAVKNLFKKEGGISVHVNKSVMNGGYYDTKDEKRQLGLLNLAISQGVISEAEAKEIKALL